jgi:voltage-dependent calcium channel L type alpha-1D
MYHSSKIRGKDMTSGYFQQLDYLPTIFFILIVTFGNFFLINLFIGVIISKYNREKELAGKDYMLTDA